MACLCVFWLAVCVGLSPAHSLSAYFRSICWIIDRSVVTERKAERKEIAVRRSRCIQWEGRVPTRNQKVREDRKLDQRERRGERQIKEIGASLTELNTDQQHQILLFIQTLLCKWTRASLYVGCSRNTLCCLPGFTFRCLAALSHYDHGRNTLHQETEEGWAGALQERGSVILNVKIVLRLYIIFLFIFLINRISRFQKCDKLIWEGGFSGFPEWRGI